VLIAISTYFHLARYLTARCPVPYFFLLGCLFDIPAQLRGFGRHRAGEGPCERPAADRQVEAGKGGVQISAPTGQRTAMIGNALVLDHSHTQ
jgi:hypothetical protein